MLKLIHNGGDSCCGFADSYIVGKKAISLAAEVCKTFFLLVMKTELFAVIGWGKALERVIEIVVIYGGEGVEGLVPVLFYPVALWQCEAFVKEAVKKGFCSIHTEDFAFVIFCLAERHLFAGEAFGVINNIWPGNVVREIGS